MGREAEIPRRSALQDISILVEFHRRFTRGYFMDKMLILRRLNESIAITT